jgi:hypothetical protein
MPLRRPPEPQLTPPEPGQPHPQEIPDPTATGLPAPAATATPPAVPEPELPPSAAQLRSAARELGQAAERADRSSREILGRAHTLCESLARSLEASDRRAFRDVLAVLLSGLLLAAATAVLATIVTLHEIDPRWSVVRLLRILLHAG